MKKILALAALLFAFNAHATTYYISDCVGTSGVDYDAACVPGSNANAGTSPSLPKQTFNAFTMNNGNTYLYAKGGAWLSTVMPFIGGGGTAGSNTTLDSYTPSWGAGTAMPLIKITDTTGNVGCIKAFSSYYITIRNLKFRGPVNGSQLTSASCIFLYAAAHHITLDNLDISGFQLGVTTAPDGTQLPIHDVILRNSTIANSSDQGFIGGGYNFLIENNTWVNNGFWGLPGTHTIYVSAGTVYPAHNTIIRGNTITGSVDTRGGGLICQATIIVVHQLNDNLVIENNSITGGLGSNGGCYGIQLSTASTGNPQYFSGTVIRGNKLVNVGTNGIMFNSCPGCLIENNILVWENSFATTIQAIVEGFKATGDIQTDNATVRNNSIYFNGGNANNIGILFNAEGTGHRVLNNVVYMGAGSSASAKCYKTLTLASYVNWDNNLCYRSGGSVYSDRYATLALAQAATPTPTDGIAADLNGSVSDPVLTAVPASGNGFTIGFTAGPTKNAGRLALCPKLAYGGLVRTGTCDIGATHQGATVVAPSSPSFQ